MIKFAAFVLAFTVSALLVAEIRDVRSANCFGCTTVKCVVREFTDDPMLVLDRPDKVWHELIKAPHWWD